MFSETMHTSAGIFNSNKPAKRYKVSTMLLFGKQAAAVSGTTQIQNNWQKNKQQPKESGDKTLPVPLQSRSEVWRLLPNIFMSDSRGRSVGAPTGCRTSSISWSLSQNYKDHRILHGIPASCFWFRSSIRCKEASPASLASPGWPLSACTSGKGNVLKSWM